MKRVVGVVVFEDELSASLANPNVPIHVEITTIADVVGDDYKLFAIVADDFYDHMNDLFDNCWRLRTADNLIITPVPEYLRNHYL